MGIEDFEWQGEADPATAAPRESWLKRLWKSVWLEPALRLGGMAALLGVLAVIGAVATTYAKPGMRLPEGPRAALHVLGTSWLKPSPAAQKDEHSSRRETTPLAQMKAALPTPSASATPAPNPAAPPPAGAVLADGRIVLNAASAEELTKLPGVGLKRAQAIVALRTKLKRFRQVTELLRVKGIGPRGLKRMLPHLVLDPP
jgi:competence protein ComEA